jgi:threonine/homoserine/homoserine lactone efflux protein
MGNYGFSAWMAEVSAGLMTSFGVLVFKGTVVMVLGALGAMAMSRASAAARHNVWLLALAGLVWLPHMTFRAPYGAKKHQNPAYPELLVGTRSTLGFLFCALSA